MPVVQDSIPNSAPKWAAQTRARRWAGLALLALAAGGAWATVHAAALSTLRLPLAVLLVQALALAAVAGVALLAVPPGLARRAPGGA